MREARAMAGFSDETKVRNEFWLKLARNASRLPFAEELVAGYYCAFDRSTPLKVKGILLAALAYFILPFDVIPDFLLGLGFTDDLAVLVTAMGLVRKHITPQHRAHAAAKMAELKSPAL
jgi:uncharacterized membrane protein YkvA (DUF1232 family)